MGKTPTFSKSDLARTLSEPLNLPKSKVEAFIDVVFTSIRARAESGATVAIAGFGRFEVKTKAARAGRNPATGETMQIPESRKLTFRPSKSKA